MHCILRYNKNEKILGHFMFVAKFYDDAVRVCWWDFFFEYSSVATHQTQ